jgi:large subunit ribosomal protein L24
MKEWSKHWKASKQPGKQRKYVHNAPLHVRRKLISAHLSKELIKKYNRRSFPLRKGDEVEIMIGNFKKKTGKVSRIDLKGLKVYVDGITRKKVDGSEVQVPFNSSNLKIINLNLEDRKRLNALNKTVKKEGKDVKAPKKATGSKVLESSKKGKKMGSKTKGRSPQKA